MGNSLHSFEQLSSRIHSGVRSEARTNLRDVPIDAVSQVIKARRERGRHFDGGLFADPAWDILLDLYHAQLRQRRATVTSLCEAAAVPTTTALRWIKNLLGAGLIRRHNDPCDRRRVFVELSPSASEAMRTYFHNVGRVLSA